MPGFLSAKYIFRMTSKKLEMFQEERKKAMEKLEASRKNLEVYDKWIADEEWKMQEKLYQLEYMSVEMMFSFEALQPQFKELKKKQMEVNFRKPVRILYERSILKWFNLVRAIDKDIAEELKQLGQ